MSERSTTIPTESAAPWVLLLEDDEADAFVIRTATRKAVPDWTIRRASSVSEALQLLRSDGLRAALVDLDVHDSRGFHTLEQIRRAVGERAPILVMTGLDDDELGLRAVGEGAQDYIVKGRELPKRVQRALAFALQRHALRRSLHDQAERRTRLAATVSHEVRNPLHALTVGLRLLAMSSSESERAELIEALGETAHQLTSTVEEVLQFASADAGERHVPPQAVDPVTLAEEVVQTLALGLHTVEPAVVVVPEASVPSTVSTHPNRLRQVLLNLVGNAVKFTGSGSIRVELSVRRGFLVVQVVDTGPGVSPGDLERLFEPYWRADGTQQTGTGLGLTIAKRLVESMGGTLTASSELGVGTTFRVRLPAGSVGPPRRPRPRGVAVVHGPAGPYRQMVCDQLTRSGWCLDAAATAPRARQVFVATWPDPTREPGAVVLLGPGQEAPTPNQARVGRLPTTSSRLDLLLTQPLPEPQRTPHATRVLVVDDDRISRMVTARTLLSAGFDVREAGSGSEALHALGRTTFDALMVDFSLPDIAGPELVRMLATRMGARLPVVVGLTGADIDGARAEGIEAGMVEVLHKPADPAHMLTSLRTHLLGRLQPTP